MLLSAPGVILAAIVLTAPGVLWAVFCYPSGSYATRVAVGLALGLAFQWHMCALLAAGPGITRGSVAVVTAAGLLVAGLIAWRKRRAFRIGRLVSHARHTYGLLAILGAATAITAAPLAAHTLPQGWDPSFHVLLASTTIATGHLPTWMPYEQIPLNYPYGPHVFIAEISLLTGVKPDQVFGGLLNALIPFATGLALYGFARQVWRDTGAALGAVAAYGLLGNWGSLDYGRWGGLPNAIGVFLLLVVLQVLFARGHEWTRVLVGGLLLGAIPLAHHHVMLTAALLLAGYSVYLGMSALVQRGQPAGRIAVRQSRRLVLMALVAFVTVSYYAVPYALRARDVQNSDVLRYGDHFTGLIFDKNGWLLWGLALAGMALMVLPGYRPGYRRNKAAQSLRLRWTGAPAFTTIASVLLLLAFVLGYYGYRALSLRVYHQPYTAFTPTRFLTDLTYFLAVFAGAPLAWLWRWAGSIRWRRATWTPVTRSLLRAALALTLIVTASITILSQFTPDQGHLAPGEAEAFAWIARNTPKNTVVVNLDPTNRWAPYFTQREVTQTPVPVSEFTTGYVDEKIYLTRMLLSLQQQNTRLVAFAADGAAVPALRYRPVALLTNSRLPSLWDAALRFRAGPELVYLLGDAFGEMLTPTPSALWWDEQQSPPIGWQTTGNLTGWSSQPPTSHTASNALYLRLIAPGASPTLLRVSCEGQTGGQLFIDGKQVPDTCTGSWQTFPGLAVGGKHVLAFTSTPGSALGPWFAATVVIGG